MKIIKDKIYRIKGKSEYFNEKYGTSNPLFKVEDTDINVMGKSWMTQNGNPACILYAMRSGLEGLPIGKGSVYYGKIGWMGELVHESELEEVKGSK